MLTVQDIYRKLDAIAPFATAESWDNSGILVGLSLIHIFTIKRG